MTCVPRSRNRRVASSHFIGVGLPTEDSRGGRHSFQREWYQTGLLCVRLMTSDTQIKVYICSGLSKSPLIIYPSHHIFQHYISSQPRSKFRVRVGLAFAAAAGKRGRKMIGLSAQFLSQNARWKTANHDSHDARLDQVNSISALTLDP